MPWTLYRYILKEMIKLLVLSSAVLVMVLSFTAAIKPLSDGLLDPLALIKFVLYSIPTMLTLMAPFAGAFASTMVFSRMAADNEIVACSASGVSYRAILLPVFLLGLGLSVSLYYLSNWVVPWFYKQSAMLVQQDITAVLVNQVKAGRPVELSDNELLYGDNADVVELNIENDTGGAGGGGIAPYRLISLQGVVLGQFDDRHVLRGHSTAQQADFYLYSHEGRNWATLRLENTTTYRPDTGLHAGAAGISEVRAFELPNPFKDDPRFLSWRELTQMSADPQLYDRVMRRKLKLAMAMAQESILRNSRRQLDAHFARGELILRGAAEQRYVIRSPAAERAGSRLMLKRGHQPVRVESVVGGVVKTIYQAPAGELRVQRYDYPTEPTIDIVLHQPTVTDVAGQTRTDKKRMVFRQTHWQTDVLGRLMQLPIDELRTEAVRGYRDAPTVQKTAKRLAYMITKTRRRIFAQVYERFALAVTSLLVLMLGAILSMKMRSCTPLVVYFFSFLLAALAVFITRSGENIASDPKYNLAISVGAIWLGDIMLLGVISTIYLRLAKN